MKIEISELQELLKIMETNNVSVVQLRGLIEGTPKADFDVADSDVIAETLGGIISTTAIPATTEQFIAKDNFIVDTSKNAKVKILRLGRNFKSWFGTKTENQFSGSSIVGRQLIESSLDAPILKELGGNKKAETTLTEIYAMMQMHASAKTSDLLANNDDANIFYVKDASGTLRAVSVAWGVGGWIVYATSINSFDEWWSIGNRVFCRDSLVA